mmetsp:Transcript_7986/g.27957  ORF Transcript_7986/g.27957 Transcript_7986/m.27957 type:complete len:216 (-) Transcript_7986:809-1456(-)
MARMTASACSITRDLISLSSAESVAKEGRWFISTNQGLRAWSIMMSIPSTSKHLEPSTLRCRAFAANAAAAASESSSDEEDSASAASLPSASLAERGRDDEGADDGADCGAAPSSASSSDFAGGAPARRPDFFRPSGSWPPESRKKVWSYSRTNVGRMEMITFVHMEPILRQSASALAWPFSWAIMAMNHFKLRFDPWSPAPSAFSKFSWFLLMA